MKKANSDHPKKPTNKPKFKKKQGKPFIDKKKAKQILKEKRARLVVKNLSFKATEENIKKYFEQHGTVSNVELLKKPDGKLIGCAFVQFTLVQFAKKAQHYTNNQPFLGRNLEVDFAKSKKQYEKLKNKEKLKTKEEKCEVIEIKEEEQNDEVIQIKEEEKSDEVKEEKDCYKTSHYSDEERSDYEDSEMDDKDNLEEDLGADKKKPFMSHDVKEGKTIFIKNVPFQATNENLRQCMLQYGPVYYALICVDKLTEHSKGTAFVKFERKEDAEKALTAGTELTLMGNVLDCHPALERDDVKKKVDREKEQKNKPKDSRNLYLVREGVILAGSKAAEGVSASDMAKRLQIEQYKTQMLRNLNTFVARDRLVVHNLPATWDDRKLKMLFQKHGGKDAVVREARIMRDMRNIDSKGIGSSKQYGFVAFTKHDNALNALRSLNNNPNIFSAQKRPIITFSIENKSALKAKIKRQEKSKLKNPKSKNFDPTLGKKGDEASTVAQENDVQSFAGVTAKEGTVQKMRSRYKLNMQAKLHYENVKKQKRKQKMAKKTLDEKKKEFIKQPKQKVNKNKTKTDDNFSKLVSDYKRMLIPNSKKEKKSKWYD